VNASAEFDPETLLPTYRIHMGVPGSSGATWVAERMGLGEPVVARAQQLLDHEDRKLEALTRDLSELRQELEAERHLALEAREQSEAARSAYEARMAQLRNAREQALRAMKGELDLAFESARSELASVMRAVQKGTRPDGRAANRARQKLEAIETRTREVEERHQPEPESAVEVDWEQVAPGARLVLDGIAGEAVLVEGPDRRGRVVVRVGGARTELPAERVRRVLPKLKSAPRPVPRVEVDRGPAPDAVTPECDLRGMRVDEALDRAEAQLHKLLGTGVERVRFIHGHGTGALRSAIRQWLRDLPEVAQAEPGGDHEGGNGVTIATLAH
jgi:DNA mismatch repair protein MutS2